MNTEPELSRQAFTQNFGLDPRARGYIDAGQLASAKIELDALGSASDRSLAPLWADVYLKESLGAKTCPEAADRASQIAGGLPQREQASVHADALAVATARQLLQTGELDLAGRALDCASGPLRGSASGRALRAQLAIANARRCLETKDWDCAFARSHDANELGASTDAGAIEGQAVTALRADVETGTAAARSEKDLGRRVQLEKAALLLWTSYLAARSTKEPASITAVKAAMPRDEQALARQVAAEQKRAETQERKRLAAEERERKREEAAAEAEERRNRPIELYCSDGTISGCGCARSSFQGCCSHHGGIDGCHQ